MSKDGILNTWVSAEERNDFTWPVRPNHPLTKANKLTAPRGSNYLLTEVEKQMASEKAADQSFSHAIHKQIHLSTNNSMNQSENYSTFQVSQFC